MMNRRTFPLLPLRGLLVFPAMVIHLDVGRDRSVHALEKAMLEDNLIVLAAQMDSQEDEPNPEAIYTIGTLARIKQMMKLQNGTFRVLVEGIERVQLDLFVEQMDYWMVETTRLESSMEDSPRLHALVRTVMKQFESFLKSSNKQTSEVLATVSDLEEPSQIADAIAGNLTIKIRDKQAILEALDVKDRLEKLLQLLSDEKEILELEQMINQRVKKQMERTQKEYYLREQMKAIQKELGEKDARQSEIEELKTALTKLDLPDDVVEKIRKELDRLERIPIASAEGSVIRTYVDWLMSLPFADQTMPEIDLDRAERILNEDHYGLEKVKERMMEHLAVQKLVAKPKGPILCLVGPPGVGKTSLARSIAKALDRAFVRVSLGGVRDEAEIRGHRRTYIGAMPGRIMQGMKTCGTKTPVFLLDEIDKMAHDFRGDPSSALLEVLDPEQNNTFSDHYIELPFDLSQVMFITTANTIHGIPQPLLDRMELIALSGYTEEEKLHIATDYLLPKQILLHGLQKNQLSVTKDAIEKIIREYTREAGVRNLERQLATLCRKAAKAIVSKQQERVKISVKNLFRFLGTPRYRYGTAQLHDQIGVATGLAYTESGGDTLAIEVSVMEGKGQVITTGQLGDVMKESAQAALSYVRTRANDLSIAQGYLEKHDLHIHVPEGAIPKDGPSAGITMATALVSALTSRMIRRDVAMTGEITLRGRVLPIGGLKEKSLAALRAGITTIIVPKDNEKDVLEIPETVKKSITFVFVEHMDQVLHEALRENKEK
nr:endopeptidase La [Bacilli bacterium]